MAGSWDNVVILGTPPVLGLLTHSAWHGGHREFWEACGVEDDWEDWERQDRLVALDLADGDDLTGRGELVAELLLLLVEAGVPLARPPVEDYDGPEPTG